MRKIRVVIVDDFPLLVEDLKESLEKEIDIVVTGTAISGKEILSQWDQMIYDVILLDIEMETAHEGIRVAEVIRERDSSAKIIFLTAHETNQVILSAMAVGATDYIVKGTSTEDIAEHIRKAVGGETVLAVKVQRVIMNEYKRLRKSEESLLFFVETIAKLTPAERELVKLLLKDYKVAEIAEERKVELVTVKTQIKSLLRKFEVARSKDIVRIIRELSISHLF